MLYYLGITFEFTATECSSGGYKARGKKYKSINIYIYIYLESTFIEVNLKK